MREKVIAGLGSPGTPTEFGFGALHGQFITLADFERELNDIVEQSNRNSEREDNSGSEDQDDEYSL
jgi:hypothetical protein